MEHKVSKMGLSSYMAQARCASRSLLFRAPGTETTRLDKRTLRGLAVLP